MRTLSGMRPTGQLHVGHLEGVVSNWTRLQETHESFFFVADLHALTTTQDSSQIKRHSLDMVKDWIAYGVDPNKTTLFVQSAVPQHTQLYTIFSMLTKIGRLERVPTFDEYLKQVHDVDVTNDVEYHKARKAHASLGFLGYPVLQAADILLYQPTVIPVGEDQLPHVELTREIAKRFNATYGDVFTIPQASLSAVPKMSGLDGRKMSKSYENVLAPHDEGEELYKKVRTIPSDPQKTTKEMPGNPDNCKAYGFHDVFSGYRKDIADMCRKGQIGCGHCKLLLADNILEKYADFREKRASLTDDYIEQILSQGNTNARRVAQLTLDKVYEKMGL